MKRTVLVFLYTLGITVICYPCTAEPMPYGYDYLGDEKSNPEPKKKPNANGFLSRLGRNWFGQNSGLTLTNEQQQYTTKNEVSLPISLGSDLYESSEGLFLPNILSGHNLYAPTKELSISKSLNEPDRFEPNKVVISKGHSQYANKNEFFSSNRHHGFDLYIPDSWSYILNEQKKELSLPSPNGQDSHETEIGLILFDGYKQYEPDKEIFLSNSPSGEDWAGLNEGISWSNEPNKQIQYANKEKLSLPKAVGDIWYRPNVDVFLPKRREENRLWFNPTINNDIYETLNTQNLGKLERYTIKVVMRHQEGMQLNNNFKDNISLTLTMPTNLFRSKQRTNEDSNLYLSAHGGQNSQEHDEQNSQEHGGQNPQEHGEENSQEHNVKNHHKKSKCKRNKKKDKNQKRFEIVHERKDCPKKDKKKSKKKKKKGKKYDKNQKRFKIVDSILKGLYKVQLKGNMQNVSDFQNNFDNHHDKFQNNHDNLQNNHNSENNGHKHDRNPEPLVNKLKEFWQEDGDGPMPDILIRRPDNFWSQNNKRPSHHFK